MSNTQLFIPEKINVGYQEREGTYTGLLAYVIYWDAKGKLRKETGWNSWRNKPGDTKHGGDYIDGKWVRHEGEYGDNVKAQAFDNVPTEGFVLNKGVGGARQSYGWNTRNEYIRVYDPRGFEFEISVENLLFILQESNSIVGKGLEGEFVYSWEGKELILLPVISTDYQESKNYSSLQSKKVTRADIEVGCAYTDKNETKLIYLGRYDYHTVEYSYGNNDNRYYLETKKRHVFYNLSYDKSNKYNRTSKANQYDRFVTTTGYTKLATRDTETPVDNYAELMDEFSNSTFGSKPVSFHSKKKTLKLKPLSKKPEYSDNKRVSETLYLDLGDNKYRKVSVLEGWSYKDKNRSYFNRSVSNEIIFDGYILDDDGTYLFDNKGEFRMTHGNGYGSRSSYKYYTKEQIEAFTFVNIDVELENGNRIKIKEYKD